MRRILILLFVFVVAGMFLPPVWRVAGATDEEKKQEFLKSRGDLPADSASSSDSDESPTPRPKPKPKAHHHTSPSPTPAHKRVHKETDEDEATPAPKPKPTATPEETPEHTPHPKPKARPSAHKSSKSHAGATHKSTPDEEETPKPKPTPAETPEPTATPHHGSHEGTHTRGESEGGGAPAVHPKSTPLEVPVNVETPAPRVTPTPLPRHSPVPIPHPRITPTPTAPPPPPPPPPPAPVTIVKEGFERETGFAPAPPAHFWTRYTYLTKSIRAEIDRAPVKRHRWRFIVVHNSGTRQGNAKAFDYYHRYVRKMVNGLAYQFVIGNGSSSGNGQIEIGDRWRRQIQGGHVHSDYLNNIAIGICLVGDFNRDLPTQQQLAALEELIRYLRLRVGKIDGKFAIVKAHREINPPRWPTDCPGNRFPYTWLHRRFDQP